MHLSPDPGSTLIKNVTIYINILIKIVMADKTKEKLKVDNEGFQKLHPYLCKGTN